MAVIFSSMDWKSTAVISGAGILATWFFSMPPTQAPAATPVRARRAAASAAAPTVDIQKEAERLQVRVRPQTQYSGPSRNLFRFGSGPGRDVARPSTAVAPPSVPVAPLPPPVPTLMLDGIASDNMNGQEQRTAIIHTDSGVVLAKEGDELAGYRVGKISADAVELTRTSDGSILRLGLR
jgi:hypothetical protein